MTMGSGTSVRWRREDKDHWYGVYEHPERGVKLEMWARAEHLRVVIYDQGEIAMDQAFEYPGESAEYALSEGQGMFITFARANDLIDSEM